MPLQAIQQALRQEALHPGTIDKVDLIQQIHHLLQTSSSPTPTADAPGCVPTTEFLTPNPHTLSPETDIPTTQRIPRHILLWYAATLDRWRRSLRAYRPLADVSPADRPRIRRLLTPLP